MIVLICVGSSCHLRGAPEIVERLQNEVAARHLEDEVTLAGSFCSGRCNREGVTVTVDDEVFTGVTPATFPEFFKAHILAPLGKEE